MTPSDADKIILARSRETKSNHAAQHDYEVVLSTVGRLAWLPVEEDEAINNANQNNNSNGGCGGGGNINSDSDSDSDSESDSDSDSDREEDNNVSYWIERIEDEGGRDEFMVDLPTMDTDTMKDTIGRHKYSKPAASTTTL